MTKRLDATKGAYVRDEYNWYREPRFPVEQLLDLAPGGTPLFEPGNVVWDPCCGGGNILDVAKARDFSTIGSDVIDRNPRHKFYRSNFLEATKWPTAPGRKLYLISNPPYGKQGGRKQIAADILHRAVHMMHFDRAAFLLPIEFVCSTGRYRFFQQFKPSHVAYCSERPSMPPGLEVMALGEDAYSGGMADYCWIIFTPPHRWRTESVWLRPSGH